MNGSEVKLAAGTNIYLNPFDLNLENKDENGDPVKVKTDLLKLFARLPSEAGMDWTRSKNH